METKIYPLLGQHYKTTFSKFILDWWQNQTTLQYIQVLEQIYLDCIGMPQSKETGDFGKRLIKAALEKEDVFRGRNIQIDAIPTGPDSIRFDVHIITDTNEPVVLSVTQNLGA